MYRGKKVKCTCFDAWVDGDDYYFNDKLLDIQAYRYCGSDISFYISVTFMYKSICAKVDEDPTEHTFYLEKIEMVETLRNCDAEK